VAADGARSEARTATAAAGRRKDDRVDMTEEWLGVTGRVVRRETQDIFEDYGLRMMLPATEAFVSWIVVTPYRGVAPGKIRSFEKMPIDTI